MTRQIPEGDTMSVKSVKLSNAQVVALQSVTHNDNGRAYVTEGKTQTLNSLRRMGILFGDGRTLTRQGLSASFACESPSMREGKLYAVVNVSGDDDSMAEYIATPVTVVDVQEVGEAATPQNVSTPAHPFVGVKMHDGTYRGLCSVSSVSTHMGSVYGDTAQSMNLCANCEETLDRCATLTTIREEKYAAEDAAEIARLNARPFVGLVQAPAGFRAVEHIHIEGCADMEKETKPFGEVDAYAYPRDMSLAEIILSNFSDVEDGDWERMIMHANSDHSGIKIMPCAAAVMIMDECPLGELKIRKGEIIAVPRPAQSGVVNCTGCGDHIMVNDVTVPTPCDDCNDVDTFADAVEAERAAMGAEDRWDTARAMMVNALESVADAPMADTTVAPVTVEAHLMITVSEGVTVDLGWHTFSVPFGCETSIPTLYGQQHGEWKNGTADWDSIIRVVESYTE